MLYRISGYAFLVVIVSAVVVTANQCEKQTVSPLEKKVIDKVEIQKDETKKQQERVKALVDRIAAEIAIERSIVLVQITSRLDNQSKFQMFTLFPTAIVPQWYTNMADPYWALYSCAEHFYEYLKFGITHRAKTRRDCSGSSFEKYQDLSTNGARAVEAFIIDGGLFLAFANFGNKQSGHNIASVIYKMSDLNGQFSLFQAIDTAGGRDIEYFRIADNHFLAVANRYNGTTSQLNSVIYKWDGRQFVSFQNILTNGATHFNFFEVFSEFFLAVSNYYEGAHPVNSVIYKWSFDQFEKFQEIGTKAAIGSTAIVVNNETLLVFANHRNTQSPVFKWSGERFVQLQSLKTHAAHDVKSFSIRGDIFLAFANLQKGGNYITDSFVYKWNGTAFVLFQFIPTRLAVAWHPFVICGQTYLGVANHLNGGNTVVYKFSGSQFIEYQEFSTHRASGMATFAYKGHTYFAIANYDGINSLLYKWV